MRNPVFGNSPVFLLRRMPFFVNTIPTPTVLNLRFITIPRSNSGHWNINKKRHFHAKKPEKFVVPKTAFFVPKTAKRRQKTTFSVPIFHLRRTFSAPFFQKFTKTVRGEHFKIGRFDVRKWHFRSAKRHFCTSKRPISELLSARFKRKDCFLNAKTRRRKDFFGNTETRRHRGLRR